MVIDYEIARTRMVKEQLIGRGITDERVLGAMSVIPRHLFIDQAFWPRAYGDHPLPIDFDQTISQPYIVALMTQALQLSGGEKVLEVGTGSGYQTAILAVLASRVFTVEYQKELSKKAKSILRRLKIDNVEFTVGDGSLGWEDQAPFDGIIVTAGAPDIPDVLMGQLAFDGRLVIPVGSLANQRLFRIIKGREIIEKHDLGGCAFVPLYGEHGWKHG